MRITEVELEEEDILEAVKEYINRKYKIRTDDFVIKEWGIEKCDLVVGSDNK